MKNRLLKFAMILAISLKAHAICKVDQSSMASIVSKVCWECTLPITMAGIPTAQGPLPDSPLSVRSPVCTCPAPPPVFYRVGTPLGYWEPNRSIDIVKDPYCFPSIGFSLNMSISQRGTKGTAVDNSRTAMNAHFSVIPVTETIGYMVDAACMKSGGGADMAYMTEIDPLWHNDGLSAIINPEALLFGNPISNLACIADSISSQVYFPLDPLFWCKGSWGNVFPLAGTTHTKDFVEDSMSIAGSFIYKLHRQMLLWNGASYTALCGEHPMPIWAKSAYRMQPIHPVTHPLAVPIGQTGLAWSSGKNIPSVGDNFQFLVFRKIDCCSF